MMRIGLYGGSFNPIHFGHLRAAEEVREALNLDLVYFIPAATPPHKPEGKLAPADHRLQLVRVATKGNRHFMVADIEIRRAGRSFTIDTVQYFRSTMKGQPEMFLMMGADQFVEFETWKDCDELTRLCHLAVHTRPVEGEKAPADGEIDPQVFLATLNRFGYSKQEKRYVNPSDHTLTFIPTTFLPISATLIRRKLSAHESILYFLPYDVSDYIQRHGLY
jgi:nicotinate-nucleotide adenylyltransferase